MDNTKEYRIRTNVGETDSPYLLNVSLEQNVDVLKILSVSLSDIIGDYKRFTSDYGVIVGRVLANEAFGIPNAKVSVFIPLDENGLSDDKIRMLYPYTTFNDKDENGTRYNLLPSDSDKNCYQVVGTFPSKRYVLDNNSVIEVYDKYYKYTTRTNEAGDYMLYGVPTGQCILHTDIDLSDVGILSQKPSDFIYQGHNISEFESAAQFKKSHDLSTLQQIITQDVGIFVYPFWGDQTAFSTIGITRMDIKINHKFEPTCIFIGSVVTDNNSVFVQQRCRADEDTGKNSGLVGKVGSIEMIRKGVNGKIEEFQIKGNQLIDGNGTWCYQIPMNLDYVKTDEFGNIVPSDNPNKGLPTRACVRFRVSLNDGEAGSYHTAKYLVPNNPELTENTTPNLKEPMCLDDDYSSVYEFGSGTRDEDFRNLYWNRIYTVKSYIPRIQKGNSEKKRKFVGIKSVNYHDQNNAFPYNRMKVDMTFKFVVMCIIGKTVINVISRLNRLITKWNRFLKNSFVLNFDALKISCIGIPSLFASNEDYVYYPDCGEYTQKTLYHYVYDGNDIWLDYLSPGLMNYCVGQKTIYENPDYDDTSVIETLDNLQDEEGVSREDAKAMAQFIPSCLALKLYTASLSEGNEILHFDFYNDWVNGTLYFPVWYMKRKNKRKKGVKNKYCKCGKRFGRTRLVETSALKRDSDFSIKLSNMLFEIKSDSTNGIRNYSDVYLKTGFIKEHQYQFGDEDSNPTVYYYATGVKYDDSKQNQYIRLFSTDIVELGASSSDNLDGIPETIDKYPVTSYQMPPMASEFLENEESEEKDDDELRPEDLTNIIETNGVLFNYSTNCPAFYDEANGYYKSNNIKAGDGHFIDLGCFMNDTYTLPKTKTNLERACEIGVDLDSETYDSDDNEIGADGFITDNEIYDSDIRAIFATLNRNNHRIYYYDTKGMLKPLYRYMYPVAFDGNVNKWCEEYTNGGDFRSYDHESNPYYEFRMGVPQRNMFKRYILTGEPTYKYRLGIYTINRTFFHKNLQNSFVLTDNSYYFYFGVKPGETALDRLRNELYNKCFDSSPIPMDVIPIMEPDDWCREENTATLKILVRNGVKPFSYTLYNSTGGVISSKVNVMDNPFDVSDDIEHKNGVYDIVVTDANGERDSERINLNKEHMTFEVIKSDIVIDEDGNQLSGGNVYVGNFIFNEEAQEISAYTSSSNKVKFVDNTTNYVKMTIPSNFSYVGLCNYMGSNWLVYSVNEVGQYEISGARYLTRNNRPCGDEYETEVYIGEEVNLQVTLNNFPIELLVGPSSVPAVQYKKSFYPALPQTMTPYSYHECSGWTNPDIELSYDFNNADWDKYLGTGWTNAQKAAYQLSAIMSISNSFFDVDPNSSNEFVFGTNKPLQSFQTGVYDYEGNYASMRYAKSPGITIDSTMPTIVGRNFKVYDGNVGYNVPLFQNHNALNNNPFICASCYGMPVSDNPECENSILTTGNTAAIGGYIGVFCGHDIEFYCGNRPISFPSGISKIPNSAFARNARCVYENMYFRKEQSERFFRVVTTDRRMDCLLRFVKPIFGGANYTYNGIESRLKQGKFFGTIINGVEMIYDESHNIVGNSLQYSVRNDGSVERAINGLLAANSRFYYAVVTRNGYSANAVNNIFNSERIVQTNPSVNGNGFVINGNINNVLDNSVFPEANGVYFPSTNFETYRNLVVSGIEEFDTFGFRVDSCSYDSPEISSADNNVSCVVNSAEGLDLNFSNSSICLTSNTGVVAGSENGYINYMTYLENDPNQNLYSVNTTRIDFEKNVILNVAEYGISEKNLVITTGNYQVLSAVTEIFGVTSINDLDGSDKYVNYMQGMNTTKALAMYNGYGGPETGDIATENVSLYSGVNELTYDDEWQYEAKVGNRRMMNISGNVLLGNIHDPYEAGTNGVISWTETYEDFNSNMVTSKISGTLRSSINSGDVMIYGRYASSDSDFVLYSQGIYRNPESNNLGKEIMFSESLGPICLKNISGRVMDNNYVSLSVSNNQALLEVLSRPDRNDFVFLCDIDEVSDLSKVLVEEFMESNSGTFENLVEQLSNPNEPGGDVVPRVLNNNLLTYGDGFVESLSGNGKYTCFVQDGNQGEYQIRFRERGHENEQFSPSQTIYSLFIKHPRYNDGIKFLYRFGVKFV